MRLTHGCLHLFRIRLVLVDVALKDVGAGTEHALKSGPVHLDALEGPGVRRHLHRRGPRLVQQQRDLPCNTTV